MSAERRDRAEEEVAVLRLALDTSEEHPEVEQTINGTKFDIPAAHWAEQPLVLIPGAITPTKKVPVVVTRDCGRLACISAALMKFDTSCMLALPELFHVTFEPATNPAPLTVSRMSWLTGAVAPLGVIDVIDELTVGGAPRYGL